MARSRNIKPGFFTNEVLAEVPPLGRILFQGLWCHADREGRLEDRPRKLKAEILPYDECDVDALLNVLAGKGFIIRYKTSQAQYIQVVNFTRHQNPHIKEPASVIPASEEHQTSTVQVSEIPEPAGLIPDSLNLIPDSRVSTPIGVEGRSKASPPACPHEEIIAAYHEALPTCPQVREWNETRQGLLRARWRDDPKRQSLDWWRKFFVYVGKSDFLAGRAEPRKGSPPFVADLEWLIRPTNFVKVIEGKYHNAN